MSGQNVTDATCKENAEDPVQRQVLVLTTLRTRSSGMGIGHIDCSGYEDQQSERVLRQQHSDLSARDGRPCRPDSGRHGMAARRPYPQDQIPRYR